MKTFSTCIAGIFLVLFAACSKDPPISMNNDPSYTVDKEIYFTIQPGNDIYTDYGFYDRRSPEISGGQTFFYRNETDSSGTPFISVQITASSELYYGGGGWFGNSPSSYLSLGNWKGHINLTKSGTDLMGNYHISTGNQVIYLINPSTRNQENYAVDTSGFSFNVTKVGRRSKGGSTVEGTFSWNLLSSKNGGITIPAIGSFRLSVGP
jgi:hypothetical protein